ncbi:helix-turn-helix transcriptional regulator [Photobacterium sp. TY1-4]|uniref:helix-turn-helix transcriptional regulator n=1 Tax=Photobacterium sp. TY1-4 TaxID=2899122 RepID=UPI0021C1BE15|nr:AraC family transcriptional regulator [Photobacterium sp. TY1-4]UXI03612.1 AraC family transcriptional regulator [Photobacterium sp. TY1-4]
MNSVYSKSRSTHFQIRTYCTKGKTTNSALRPTSLSQSMSGCLGCQIHTLSGYGGCISNEPHKDEQHHCLRLLTVLRGERLLWHNGSEHPTHIGKGKSVLIFSANTFNDVFISEEESFIEIADIRFDCQYLSPIYQQMKEQAEMGENYPFTENQPIIFDTSFEIQHFIRQLSTEAERKMSDVTDRLYNASQAYLCLSKLLGQLEAFKSHKKAEECPCLSSRTLNKIRKAHTLIESDPGRNWSIGALCQEVGTNETSFKRGFKLLFNTTFSKLLQQARMDIAASELKSTDRPIIDIVYKVGYSSPSHFTKLFKQHFGQNPLQYRKSHQSA